MLRLTRETRDIRYHAMSELMERESVDALLFSTYDFTQWVSNFHVQLQAWERPGFICIPQTGEAFGIFSEVCANPLRACRERNTLWLGQTDFYAEHIARAAEITLQPDLPVLLARRFREAGLASARIGVDALGDLLKHVAVLLPDAEFVVLTAQVRQLRWVKTHEELEIMRAACALADWTQERYRENIRAGRLVHEMDLQMALSMAVEGARRFPGQHLEIIRCWTLTGASSALPHGDDTTCGAVIAQGDTLLNIVIPRLNGIVVENERTWFCDEPSAQQAAYYNATLAANEASLAAAVTGQPVSGIDHAAIRVIEDAGFGNFACHRTGHGMGILGHEYPGDMAFNDRPLLANEVYSAEPGIYVYGLGGFRIDDTVVVGSPPEILTRSPKSLENAIVMP